MVHNRSTVTLNRFPILLFSLPKTIVSGEAQHYNFVIDKCGLPIFLYIYNRQALLLCLRKASWPKTNLPQHIGWKLLV